MLHAFVARGRDLAEAVPDSLIALAARIAAGGVFWRSGQTKLDGLGLADSAYFLFREEYRLPVLPPDAAAILATFAENLFSVLLILGLASRLSAAALLTMTAVIQVFVYPSAWPEHLLWAVALLVVLARGPGRLSVDHALGIVLRRREHRASAKT